MATRNIVPRATGEGSIGTSAKTWGAVYADDIAVTNAISGDLVGDVTGTASGNLALTGGTLTGDLDLTNIKNSGTDAVRISGGADFNPSTGAMLTLFHKNHTNAGGFRLFANNGGASKMLEGKTDGSLAWNGWSIPAGYLGDAPANTNKTFTLPAGGTYLIITAHNSTPGTNSIFLVSLGSGAFKMGGGTNITMTTSGQNITVTSTNGSARVYYIILNTLS